MNNSPAGLHGYADATPSESIQRHALPGMAVAIIFPYKPGEDFLDIPVKQYKECKLKKKAENARKLTEWLIEQKENGLLLTGFVNSHTQATAATLGMNLVKELPCTKIEPHYNSFRLNFDGEYIDFAQAFALEYYYSTISFGILHAGQRLPPGSRKIIVFMDRFLGVSIGSTQPGESAPVTQGFKFICFIRTRSATGKGIVSEDKKFNLESRLDTIDWWKLPESPIIRKGKTHPHFVLPDWLAVSAIAHKFRDDFISHIKKDRLGEALADALIELYSAFKTFDIWSMSSEVPLLIRPAENLLEIPDKARDFILRRVDKLPA